MVSTSCLAELSRHGQSVWIDWLSRDLLLSGGLRRLISKHAVTGVTTNPTILERAISGGRAYGRQIRELRHFNLQPVDIFGELTATDVTEAALQLVPVWQATGGADGYVSWEVDPTLAWNADATLPRCGGCSAASTSRTCSSRSPQPSLDLRRSRIRSPPAIAST